MHRWKFSALASALSLCTAFMASPAAALSLGAIHVQSHLGEPLRAEIDITQITAAEAGSLQATLASPDVFQAHGMELSPTARNVRVELISPAKGGSKIRLTTTSPVNDPFIDLILQANWSAGNLTRGYTLLLDPPPVQKPPAPTTAVQASTPAQTGQTYRSQPRTAAPSASSAAAATGTTDATSSVTVRTGDTAGRIAAAHAISGISLDQMLVAMLRTKYSEAMGATYLDRDGKQQVMEMGCYGIGVSRIVGAAIEQNFDERGIIFTDAMAPFTVSIVPMGYRRSEAVQAAADALYAELKAAGVDVLLDDRDERPGVLLADCELIGIPHRVVIGDRGLKEGVVEYQARRDSAATSVPLTDIAAWVQTRLSA